MLGLSGTDSPPVAAGPRRPDLESRQLMKGYGQGDTRTLAVNDVGIRLHRGEVTLLMGPSGSGKSTLLAMISGLLRPDSGQVVALDQDIWARSKVEMERFRLNYCSFIFQGCNCLLYTSPSPRD